MLIKKLEKRKVGTFAPKHKLRINFQNENQMKFVIGSMPVL
jgi:hypothetical protein